MSIMDRQWGTQQSARKPVDSTVLQVWNASPVARGLDKLGAMVSDAAAVARLLGRAEVTIGVNADGRDGLTFGGRV